MNFKITLTVSAIALSTFFAVNSFAQQENRPVRIPAPDSMTAAAPEAVVPVVPAVPAEVAPAAPKVETPAVAPAPVATPSETPAVTPEVTPTPAVEPQPIPVEVPTEVVAALDATFVDKLSAAVNTKKFDDVFHFFAKDGFVLITPMGEAITTEAAFKTMFDSMHGENGTLKNAKVTFSADSVTNLSPVLGFITTKEVITFPDAPEKKMEGMKSMLLKKEGNDWKIMAVQASSKDAVEMMLPKAPVMPEQTMMQKMQMPIIAFVAGFIIAFMISRKRKDA